MAIFNCDNKFDCTGFAIVTSLIIGIIAAFLQITAVITLTPVFSIVALGVALLYLAVALITSALTQKCAICNHKCTPLSALLVGILGTILFSVILLAVTCAATSVIGAIIVGALFFSFSLMITSTACFTRCVFDCDR